MEFIRSIGGGGEDVYGTGNDEHSHGVQIHLHWRHLASQLTTIMHVDARRSEYWRPRGQDTRTGCPVAVSADVEKTGVVMHVETPLPSPGPRLSIPSTSSPSPTPSLVTWQASLTTGHFAWPNDQRQIANPRSHHFCVAVGRVTSAICAGYSPRREGQ